MIARTTRWVRVLACFACFGALSACEEAREARLCVTAPDVTECDEGTMELEEVSGGDAYRILHVIPEGIRVDDPVRFTVRTPCTTQEFTASHVSHAVSLVRVAPPGSECGFAVEATLFNSEERFQPKESGQCTEIDAICAAASAEDEQEDADRGTADGGTPNGGEN